MIRHWFAFLICCCAPALPLAQTVDQASIAAVQTVGDAPDRAQAMAPDPVTADVVSWLRLRAGQAGFADYNDLIRRRPDWPGRELLRARAETALPANLPPGDVIDWFANSKPQTAKGTISLVQALLAENDGEMAQSILQQLWTKGALDRAGQATLIAAFPDRLAGLHAARGDALLWRGQTGKATDLLAYLPPVPRALTAARIGYRQRAGNLPDLVAAIPPGLRDDPGLAYARYDWLARRGERSDAIAMLLARTYDPALLGQPLRWSGWRRVLARWDMREGRPERAYRIAATHHLDSGTAFVDLEWLAGYLALTYLGNPTQALAHFQAALPAATGPISLSRLQYWIGRAYDAKGNDPAAQAAYAAGAAYQTAFYGLLSSERLGLSLDPALIAGDRGWQGAPVFDDDIVQAALTLLKGGERGAAFTFFSHIGRTFDADALAQLGAYLNHIDEQRYSLLLGKIAVTRGILIPSLYHPVHDLAQVDMAVDPALALAIARQESEFNAGIGSPAGALGLMQIMPGTAAEVAKNIGLPYSRGRLTSDWRYNATLGTAYLEGLQNAFGNSPVLIAAGYNAGPGRPRDWIAARGDPRLREMDVIDWIEHIPFRETRNYVMRVTEGLMVYRARLSGTNGAVSFTDLLIGEKPLVRPRARP